jgi:hypothetical protein
LRNGNRKARTNPETIVALSESDIAMINTLGILFHIAIGGRDATGQQVAAALLGLMKRLATDPKMLACRRQRAILRYAIPKGRA